MKYLHNILFYLTLSICLISCSYQSETERLLDKAQAYLEFNPDSAFVALDSLDRRHLNTKELRARHALLYSIALEKVGIDMTSDNIINIALEYYLDKNDKENAEIALTCREKIASNIDLMPQMDTLQMQNARIIQERYDDKIRLITNRRAIIYLIICSILVFIACLCIIKKINRKLHLKPDDKSMELIHQRLAVLDKVLASYISSDEKTYRISEEEIENLMSDREEFLVSTKIIFKESHPDFIISLEEKGLTDWEVGYCCLYTLGLKGKDVGKFIQKKRHYIISSEIRKKLGLDEHDTNIGIWLRNHLTELEKGAV